jgi:hypothetical protein
VLVGVLAEEHQWSMEDLNKNAHLSAEGLQFVILASNEDHDMYPRRCCGTAN